jgi:hypothetical protein
VTEWANFVGLAITQVLCLLIVAGLMFGDEAIVMTRVGVGMTLLLVSLIYTRGNEKKT